MTQKPEELLQQITDTVPTPEKKPTMVLNEKGVDNPWIRKHVFKKGITKEDIVACLRDGTEVTVDHPKEGSRYFKIETSAANLPGRFVIPDPEDKKLGPLVTNWNCPAEVKIRHGKLCSVIKRADIPTWLVDYTTVFYVIIEKNERPDKSLQIPDGPTEKDPEGSWIVSTAHYGEPSRRKPRIPKDPIDTIELKKYIENPKIYTPEQLRAIFIKVKEYLEDMEAYTAEQSRVIFVDFEPDVLHQAGLSEKPKPFDENAELRGIIAQQQKEIEEIRSTLKGLQKKQNLPTKI